VTGDGARRARLELLIRADDGESFEVRQFTSAAAWIQLRPRRVAPELFELAEVASRVDPAPSFILKNRATERFLLLSERERFLWEQMDGGTSLRDMATAYVVRYGEFDFDIIPTLIRKLQRAQLLTLAPASRMRRALARNRRRRLLQLAEAAFTALERIHVGSREVHPFFARLYRWGGFLLFTRAATLLWLVLGVAGLAAGVGVWRDAAALGKDLSGHPVAAVVSVKLLFLASVAVHQVVHGLALVHYGRRVREFGFTLLHGFLPTFYVDVTDIFMTGRRARIVTAISGAAVHLVVGSLWFLAAAWMPGFGRAFAAASGMVQWQAFVIALYPFCFVEMDGYHVLVDALGVPTLKHDAMAYVGALARGAAGGPLTPEKRLWLGYVALSALSVGVFVAFNVWIVLRASS
jgi:putative peptide zinc metalloprotease protein